MSEGLKIWYPVISSGIAVMFIVLYLGKCGDKPVTKPSDNTQWRTEVDKRDVIIATKDTIISKLKAELATVKSKARKDSSVLHRQATVNYKRYSEARKDIQQLRDSIPVVMAFVDAADSLVAVKELQYRQEVNHRIALDSLYQIEVATLGEKNVVQKQISELQATKIIDLQSENGKLAKRLDRKRKGNRLLGGIALGLGAALGVIILTQ